MSLSALFAWAVSQAEAAQHPAPSQIHTQTMPRDRSGVRLHTAEIIRPMPFTVAFERYIDDDEQKAPIEKALDALYSPRDRHQSLEFEIGWAVVKGGHTDPSVVRSVLGNPRDFDRAAVNALALLKQKTLEHAHDQMRAVHGKTYVGDKAFDV